MSQIPLVSHRPALQAMVEQQPPTMPDALSFDASFQVLVEVAKLSATELVEPDEPNPEHQRYAVYKRAVGRPELRSLLLACLADDPDPLMASDILVLILDLVDASQRHAVVSPSDRWPLAFAQQREFVQEWARDLDKLDAIRVEQPEPMALHAILEGSDRLQGRVVRELASDTLLQMLEENGRTRRVRSAAGEALRANGRARHSH